MKASNVKGTAQHQRLRLATLLTAASTLVLAACSSGAATDVPVYQSAQPGETSGSYLADQNYATTNQVLEAVAAAQQLQTLPDVAAAQLVALERGEVIEGAETCFDKRETNVKEPYTNFGECAYGDPDGTRQMVIYGDSRAPMWAATLERVAAKSGWQLRVFSKGGCPVADLQFQDNGTKAPSPSCDAFHVNAVEEIRKLNPELIVTTSHAGHRLASGEWPTPTQWRDAWVSTFQKLAQPGNRVVMLGSVPNWENNDAECLAAHTRDVQACSTERANAVTEFFEAERAAADAAGSLYIDTVPWICAERCQPVIADLVVYYNPYHITNGYADYLSGALAESLAPAMA